MKRDNNSDPSKNVTIQATGEENAPSPNGDGNKGTPYIDEAQAATVAQAIEEDVNSPKITSVNFDCADSPKKEGVGKTPQQLREEAAANWPYREYLILLMAKENIKKQAARAKGLQRLAPKQGKRNLYFHREYGETPVITEKPSSGEIWLARAAMQANATMIVASALLLAHQHNPSGKLVFSGGSQEERVLLHHVAAALGLEVAEPIELDPAVVQAHRAQLEQVPSNATLPNMRLSPEAALHPAAEEADASHGRKQQSEESGLFDDLQRQENLDLSKPPPDNVRPMTRRGPPNLNNQDNQDSPSP